MPIHKVLKLIVVALISSLGNSFPAVAQSNEKDPQDPTAICEPALTPAALSINYELVVQLPSQGATDIEWTLAENSLWLVSVDKNYGKVRLYEPLKSPVEAFSWENLTLSQDHSPEWSADSELQLELGDQAMKFDFLQPSRVRIMPVGKQPTDQDLRKIKDDSGAEVSVFVNSKFELNVAFHNPAKIDVKVQLPSGGSRTPQVLRGKNGTVLILVERSPYTHSNIFALAKGVLSPVAVVPASFLFAGINGDEMVAWSEAAGPADQFSVKLARLESLTSPVFSFPLEAGEIVKSYKALPESGLVGFLAVLTSQRILLIKYSSR